MVWKNYLGIVILIVLAFGVYFIPKNSTVAEEVSIEEWKKIYREEVKVLELESSPVTIEPFLHHPGIVTKDAMVIQEDIWVIGFVPEVINGPNELLHHSDYMNITAPLKFCSGVKYPFFAASKELTSGIFPIPYAYKFSKGDQIRNLAMYHNHSSVRYKDVRVRLNIWYISKDKADLKETEPLFLDVTGACFHEELIIPPRTDSFKKISSEPHVVEHGGKVVLYGHHVHDYAKHISLKLNGKILSNIVPENDDRGHLISLPVIYPKNLLIKKGDKLDIETEYWNPLNREHDAMAEILMFVHPM